MHRTIGYLSKRFVHIRPGEGRKVLLTFLYFFLIITAYYVIKPVSRSLVLDGLGHRMVPYMDLISAILMGPIVTGFARLVDRVSKPRLVTIAFAFVTGMMLLFWRLLTLVPASWVAAAFYVWVAIFSVLTVTLFWLVANDLYRPRDAKRLFGFIGSGGIIGGITGSSIAAFGAQWLGTDQLLLVSAAALIAAWGVVQQLWRESPEAPLEGRPSLASPRHETFLADIRQFARLLASSRYLLLLVSIVALNKLVTTLVYYQLNPFIEHTFATVDAKTAFTGLFLGGINALAFVVQFFLTSWVLRRWGLAVAMLVMPVGLLAGSATLLFAPVFAVAAGTELFDRALDYSLNNTSKEVLYLPLDRSVRYKVKPFIDMVVFRFGKGVAAVIGIVLLDWLNVSPRWLCLLTIPLLCAWVAAALRMRREYTTTIRTVLQARSARRAGAGAGAEELAAAMLGALTAARLPQVKLDLAARLVTPHANSHAKELLDGLASYEAHQVPPRLDARFEAGQLRATIQDRDHPIIVRRHAVRLLARQADQDALDYLCGMLIVEEEPALRDEVLRELVKMRLARRALQFPVPLLRRQVEREVRQHARALQVAAIYRQQVKGRAAPDDPVIGLLKMLVAESVEQVFRLLMLLYRPEDIHLVYEQMRVPETQLRADAIELLDNLLDPQMRHVIFPILDEDGFLSSVEADGADGPYDPAAAYRVLQEAIWDANCWLSVTTLCAVGRLRLSAMRQEIERAARHSKPLIASAAKVALCISPLL